MTRIQILAVAAAVLFDMPTSKAQDLAALQSDLTVIQSEIKAEHRLPQFVIEAGHHRDDENQHSDAEHHAGYGDQRDHRDECALRTQITEGEKKLEGQTGHEQVGQAGAVLCSLKRVMAHAAP